MQVVKVFKTTDVLMCRMSAMACPLFCYDYCRTINDFYLVLKLAQKLFQKIIARSSEEHCNLSVKFLLGSEAYTQELLNRVSNIVVVRFYDESRRVAGDCWQVAVRYDAVVSVSETFRRLVSGEPELLEKICAALGAEIVLTHVSERNFISVAEKEVLVAHIVSRARKNIFCYLADPGFYERFF
jgi:hypothetical protein